MITYLETETIYFWGNMKVLLGHLDYGLVTNALHSDPAEKPFFGLCNVSNVSKWPKPLLKMG